MDTHPNNAPICYVQPTAEMGIRVSMYVDCNGKIYLPYLHEWSPRSDMVTLIQVMIVTFGESPPVFKTTRDAAHKVAYAPNPYMPQPHGVVAGPAGGYLPYPPNGGVGQPATYMPYPGTGAAGAGGSSFPAYPMPGASGGGYPHPFGGQPGQGTPYPSGGGGPNTPGNGYVSGLCIYHLYLGLNFK